MSWSQYKSEWIPNIPPIKIISYVGPSCYLIDFEGNLWTFGSNYKGQLGNGNRTHINTPKIINTLKDIQQISYGSCGLHFLAKNSQNQIFVSGYNSYGQLGTGDTQSLSIPKNWIHNISQYGEAINTSQINAGKKKKLKSSKGFNQKSNK